MDLLPEPWSILIAMLVCSFVPALWFSNKVIIINEENKTVFDGIWTMGKKLGKPVPYDSIEKIFINKVKTKQTQYSLSNQQNIIANHEFRVYLKLNDGTKYFLLSHPLEERANEKAEEVRKKLELSVE